MRYWIVLIPFCLYDRMQMAHAAIISLFLVFFYFFFLFWPNSFIYSITYRPSFSAFVWLLLIFCPFCGRLSVTFFLFSDIVCSPIFFNYSPRRLACIIPLSIIQNWYFSCFWLIFFILNSSLSLLLHFVQSYKKISIWYDTEQTNPHYMKLYKYLWCHK